MRVVITGATGNTGTSLLGALGDAPEVESILGLARRRPEADFAKTTFAVADVAEDDLVPHFRGADVVVHLAWLIQPSRDLRITRRANVDGSRRVFRAVGEAGVPALVYASSVGAYSPGPKDRRVDESWPTDGIPSSFYSRQKSEVERLLDRFERDFPDTRTARLRPGLIFKDAAAPGIRRLFAGPLVPTSLLRPSLIPVVPDTENLRFQAVHSLDIGRAYALAVTSDAHGAFNIAAEPVLDPPELGRLLGARPVPVPPAVLRGAAKLSWKAGLQPTPPGWVDMALEVPLMATSRARAELGWEPQHSGGDALLELIEGMRASAGAETPVLSPRTGGLLRVREFLTGIGRTSR
ncbi:MAG: NAD-dependent epimerase/dehydratase family protein [Actinomycetota bacterium]|nr:NAD-dependent epimerase/dehydratase family protein [Actinomycetota bacterium]